MTEFIRPRVMRRLRQASARFVESMWRLPRISMRADCSSRNYRDTDCVKHHRRAARFGRTIDKSGKILTERARARGASPIATYFLAAL